MFGRVGSVAAWQQLGQHRCLEQEVTAQRGLVVYDWRKLGVCKGFRSCEPGVSGVFKKDAACFLVNVH